MDEDLEIPLAGGWATEGVVRVGQTVRRPRGANADFVEQLLGHLERVGFNAAPRHLGVDEQGRDILEYFDGQVSTDCAGITWSDEQLSGAMALLRRFHDATAGSDLAAGEEVVCHGDFGPWNLIWVGDGPVSIIDFDNAAPSRRLDDVGYAVWKHLNLGLLPLGASKRGGSASQPPRTGSRRALTWLPRSTVHSSRWRTPIRASCSSVRNAPGSSPTQPLSTADFRARLRKTV